MKKLYIALITLTGLMGGMGVQAQTETVLFKYTDAKEPYRIPAIATMSNGEIIAISDHRPGGNDVGNNCDVDIYARISDNNGVSWTGEETPHSSSSEEVIKIADGCSDDFPDIAFGDAAVAAHPETGEVLVMCVGAYNTSFSSADKNTSDYYCYRFYSNDYGRTWNKGANITPQMKGDDSVLPNKEVYAMFFASGRLHVSRYHKNRIYGALYTKEASGERNYVLYTEDFGESWKCLGNDVAIGKETNTANEAKVEELPNGDVLISSRKAGGRYFNVYSFEQGKWLEQTEYTFGGNASCNGELLLYNSVKNVKNASDTEEYALLLQSLPIGSTRKNVTIFYKLLKYGTAYTPEEIESGWTEGRVVYSGNSAYSTMTIMPDGNIGFLYEKDYCSSNFKDNFNYKAASGGTANIVFVPYTIENVTGGNYTKVVSKSLTIGATGYATFFAPYAVKIPQGITAKYVNTEENAGSTGVLKYTELQDVIPANTAVVLKGEPGYYEFTTAYGTANVTANNALFGYAVNTPATDNTGISATDNNDIYIYALANKSAGVAFYPFVGSNYAAGKAYLNVNKLQTGSEVRSFALFDEDDATAIETLPGQDVDAESVAYDLSGRRVQKVQKGLYIVNGKKVIR
ncbi:MAG: exo-alpha-sialidase [Bacteroidaceae bacterium]|nr:exo-alpha-sialidase [Bacteroidaceae bacterium]